MHYLLIILIFILSLSTFAQTTMISNRGAQFNPAFGLNTMMLMKNSQVHSEGDGFSLQGVELQFNADVDAYFRAQIVIGFHPEGHDHDEEEEVEEDGHGAKYLIHPEEAFVETIAIPNVTFKGGKFLTQFGKYNAIHLHALPFIYRSLVHQEMFGHEGFSAVGLGAAVLVPFNWFSELTLEALQPQNEQLFEESHHATAYVAKLRNLWDLSDAMTLEWGVSGLSYLRAAYNDNEEEKTILTGTDLTIKWRPTNGGRSQSFMWSTEYINKKREGTIEEKNAGVTSFLRYQFKQRWFGQLQYEYLGIDRSEGENYAHGNTALIGFIPSEFSAVRLQFDHIKSDDHEDEQRLSLQFNMSIGAHPAHMY